MGTLPGCTGRPARMERITRIARRLVVAAILAGPVLGGTGSCTAIDPRENGDGELMALLQPFLYGRLNLSLLATDDQGDANINQFTLDSGSPLTPYTVTLTSSSITFELVEADLALREQSVFERMALRIGRALDSSLHAHGQSTSTIAVSESYTAGQNVTLSGFHTATRSILTGQAYVSEPFTFPAVRPGTLALLQWHVTALHLAGTVTDGTTPHDFDLTLPVFDAELIPTCGTSITIGSSSNLYTTLKLHNLFKDTSDATNGHILDRIYTANGMTISSTSHADMQTVILSNTDRAFVFYGCRI